MKKKCGIIIIVMLVLAAGVFYSYGDWERAIYDTGVGSNSYTSTELLTGDMVVEQSFLCPENGFNGIRLRIAVEEGKKLGSYQWQLLDGKSGQELSTGILDESMTNVANFSRKPVVLLEFPRQEDSAGKEYLLRITALEVQEEEAMALYTTENGQYSESLTVGKEVQKESLIVRMTVRKFQKETFVVFLGLGIYVALFVVVMRKLFR